MTQKQKLQYNKMLATLKRIAKGYQTPDKMRRDSDKDFGLGYQECLEMAYENIQNDAAISVKNVRPITD